jgi:hypothetical protein
MLIPFFPLQLCQLSAPRRVRSLHVISKRNLLAVLFCLSLCASAQTADEIIQKNIAARGGLEKLKALTSMRQTFTLEQGAFKATGGQESKRPNFVRSTFTIQGMTAVTAYDGASGWRISPFQGKKDPELVGEDDLKGLQEQADFDGPLIDYQSKGNTVEYMGVDQVDGDDAYKLKVTLKNGDIFYYYFDPDTYLEIQRESQIFIRGSMRESVTQAGSYKAVNGIMFPFSSESWPKSNPQAKARVTVQKIELNVPVDDSDFKMPTAPK